MSAKLHHVMIGLPEAGKTTYLAALWHVLCSDEVDGSLRLARLVGDQTYLNKIREAWAKASPVGRTNPGNEPNLCFHLVGESSKDEIEIRVPDISGEAFEADWVERSMENDRANLLTNAAGAILFVNPENLRKEVLISEVAGIAGELDRESSAEDDRKDDSVEDEECTTETSEWRADVAPTQIQLVDLLQMMLRLNSRRPFSLAVVVSAWDQVRRNIKPENWVKKELPLLWQFLRSNSPELSSTYYGVSAQGGDLEKDADELKAKDSPSERIVVVSATETTSSDITLPLRCLMKQANA